MQRKPKNAPFTGKTKPAGSLESILKDQVSSLFAIQISKFSTVECLDKLIDTREMPSINHFLFHPLLKEQQVHSISGNLLLFCFLVTLFLITNSYNTKAQFPAPTSFQISINYILIGEEDWCNDQIVYGPNYCNLYGWETPDTSSTTAILTAYRVYKDDQPFLFSTGTWADTIGAFPGSFYVTAIYDNPSGESPPSNGVVIEDLPIKTKDNMGDDPIRITWFPALRVLSISEPAQAKSLAVFNTLGQLVLADSPVENQYRLEGITTGTYWVVIWSTKGKVNHKLVLLAK